MTITTAAPARVPKRSRDARESGRLAGLLLSPTFLVLVLVVGYPVIAALRDSLYERSQGLDANGFVVQGDRFVGLKNYIGIFSGDNASAFWNAFWNTTFFTVAGVLIETVLGVAMALVMHQAFRGRAIVRASIQLSWGRR